ncbi:hypothetical protein GCM10010129_42790 [Streptomyces fumigatiscleroticus]|nr:hypothetical protein GCM10010129_42790 [Streptomyces fumigatiscleroticus]
MLVKQLHAAGVKSEHAYGAAFASAVLSLGSWACSPRRRSRKDEDRAGRGGVLVGEWALMCLGIGLALVHYEKDDHTFGQ